MLRKGVKLLIKKMVDYKKALVAILENTLKNVNAGNTNITEEEASVIIDHLTMLNKGVATVSKANTINGIIIGEGSVKITIPFMNKTVVFDKDDFNELKTNIENYEKSK